MKTTVLYTCNTCADQPQFDDAKKMFTHLREVHKIEGNPIKGTQTPFAFMDGAGWKTQIFDLHFEGVHIVKDVTIEYGTQN